MSLQHRGEGCSCPLSSKSWPTGGDFGEEISLHASADRKGPSPDLRYYTERVLKSLLEISLALLFLRRSVFASLARSCQLQLV